MDADTGRILSSKGAHDRRLIASTTKIMTALVAIERLDLDTLLVIPKEAVGIEGSSMYLKDGEELTVRELLYGLMLHSGNDAAVALAIAACGDVPSFVEAMNKKAADLGLHNTHYENPNGLDGKEHYSTAYDLALLTAAAMKNPCFSQIVGEKQIQLGSRSFRNHNKLLWMGQGITGVKTGFTKAAGRTLVSSCSRKGRSLIAVTLCDGNDWQDHLAMYDFGFSQYEDRTLLQRGQLVAHVPLMDGRMGCLYADQSLRYSLSQGEMPSIQLRYPSAFFGCEDRVLADVYIGDLLIDRISLKWENTDEGTITENHSLPRSVFTANCRGMDSGRPCQPQRTAGCDR